MTPEVIAELPMNLFRQQSKFNGTLGVSTEVGCNLDSRDETEKELKLGGEAMLYG